jgi:hypothetical protein
LISKLLSVSQLCEAIHRRELGLRVALDYPQLFTAEHYNLEHFPIDRFIEDYRVLHPHRHLITRIHVWGKTKRPKSGWTAPYGDLNDLFYYNAEAKKQFLDHLIEFYSDDEPRYFVPEVNTASDDLRSIVNDFIDAGADFSSP